MEKTVLIIAGPTAAGKTATAIRVARRLGSEIISADSRQFYKELNIGVARPTVAELNAVRHHFVATFPVSHQVNAAEFEQLALNAIDDIHKQTDVAIVCGGSGLYIKALCEGLDEMPGVRGDVEAEVKGSYEEQGMEWLQKAVAIEDPAFFATGETQNPVRMMRALAFVRSNGESILRYRTQTKKHRPFRIVKTALDLPRTVLYERINVRVDDMMKAGLLAEVQSLEPLKHLKNLQTVGYQELFGYLSGQLTLAEAVLQMKQHTRNYAKRQLTWFRKDAEMVWLRADDVAVDEKLLRLVCPVNG